MTARNKVVDAIEGIMYVALGFAPTLAALEIAWKMGRMTGRRGEVASFARAH